MQTVPDEVWLSHVLDEVAKCATEIANLRFSDGEVAQSQTSVYKSSLVESVNGLASYAMQWNDQFIREEQEAMKESPVDMDHVSGTRIRGDEDTMSIDHGHQTFPFDLPVKMQVTRLMDDVKQPDGKSLRGLIGWKLTINPFTFGVDCKVELVILRHGIMRLLANGLEVQAWQKEGGVRAPTSDGTRESHEAMGAQWVNREAHKPNGAIETTAVEVTDDELLDDDDDLGDDDLLDDDDLDTVME
jgi:hypothetical protein